MPHHFSLDIGFPAPFARTFDDGLLAALATRPGALRTRIPDEPAPKPAPTPTKSRPPAPKPVTPPSKPTPAKATPVKSTDQGKAGVAATRPPKSPPAAPAPKPKIVDRPKSPPAAPKPKATTTTPAKTRTSSPAPTTTRPAKTSGSTPTTTRSVKGGGATPTKTRTSKPGATTPTKTKAGVTAPTKTKPGATTPTRTKAGVTAPTRTKPGATTPTKTKSGVTAPTKTAPPSNPTPDKAAIRRMESEYLARNNAETLDDLTDAQRQQLLEDQAALERTEDAARERNKPEPPPTGANGRPVNRAIAEELAASNSSRATTEREEVVDAREDYFETHDTWVDVDGTVYAASLDANGNIVLDRDQRVPAQGENPALDTNRSVTIATDRSRTDVATTRNVPTGAPGEVRQTRTETSHTGADGTPGESQIRLEQERENRDGSEERSLTEENYDARGVATSRIQEQERTSATGDSSLNRTTTEFRNDGQTPESTTTLATTASGSSDATTSRETTTNYAADGATPNRQVVTEGGTDAEGEDLLQTRATTEYAGSGGPRSTYIQRTGGELPEEASRTEYVVWGADGQIDRRINGGSEVSAYEYERFVEDGTRPVSSADTSGSFFDDVREMAGSFIQEGDPDAIPGGEDPVRWTRGGDDRWTGETLDSNLVEPLQASTETPSVFEIPAAVRTRASAAAIDQSAPATDPAAFNELDQDQQAFEQQLAGATTDQQRERIMSEYFADHQYWIDRGEGPDAQPVLMASAWSTGAPYNADLFGGSRATDPHATMARTGIEGQDDMGQPATVDVVQNLYVDGSQDDIVRTSYDGPAGASRVTVTGEHTNAAGVVVERDSNAQTQVARTEQGLEPLAVTEISRERFNPTTGDPQGEQYFAVAQSDSRTTSLEERRDYYGVDGVIYDTKIDSTSMSRNYDADITEDFLDANQRAIDAARSDDFSPNSDEFEVVTVPPAGSNYVHTTTDIDYDDEGIAIYQLVEEESVQVADSGDDNNNGVRVTETNTTRESGTRGGSTAIFDPETGALAVNEDVETTIKSTEFDPDAGVAGGNRSAGHQFREISTITMTQTRAPNGDVIEESATPLTTQTLREGFDDDWQFDEKNLKTKPNGELEFEGEGDERRPIEVGDSIHHEDLDFADKFEEFMEGWGGKIIGVAAIVAGVAGAVFTGGASLALTVVGVGLASASFAYTALNYSQGEASGWDLALSGAGVVLAGLPAITGVKQLVNAGRAAQAARVAGAADDVVRSVAQNALRTGPGLGRTGTNVLRTGNAADNAMDANDAIDATRAALQGDFWGAGMMLLAVGGGAGAVRVRARFGNAPAVGSPGSAHPSAVPPRNPAGAPGATGAPASPDLTTPAGTTPGSTSPDPLRPTGTGTTTGGGPATSQGAPSVTMPGNGNGNGSTTLPTSGTNTGAANPAPQGITPNPTPDSSVAGARGNGVPDTPNTSTPASAPATTTVDGASLIQPTPTALPSSPMPTVFSDAVIADPRAAGATPDALWGSDANYQRHVDSHVGNYAPDRMAAAGLEVPTTASGRPIVDAASYHERALDYREMAVTGRLEDGVTSYPRANGGTMLVNSRTNEVAFINADGSIGSLYPTYAVRTAADGTYRRNGNQENRLNNFVQKELASDAQVYAIRTANANGDQAGLNQALESLREMNPNRYDAISRELGLDATVPQGIFGRRNTVVGPSMPVAPVHLDRPFPTSAVPTDANRLGTGAIMRNPNAIVGLQFNVGDTIPWRVDGVSGDGTVTMSTSRQRPFNLDEVAQNNPELVAQLGGLDAIRWNPRLLEGHDIRTTRSTGAVEGGFRFHHDGTNPSLVRTERRQSSVTEIEMQTGGFDLAGSIARSQGPDLLAGRARLQTAVESFPELLYNRPLRLLRGAHAQNQGQVVSPISDGWYVTASSRNALGEATVDLQRNVRFDELDAAGQAAARAQGHVPGSIVLQSQSGIPVAEIVDFNRSRIEGRRNSAIPPVQIVHGALPGMRVEPGTTSGVVDPNQITDPATRQRYEHLQSNVEAIYDYMYSRVGWVPQDGMANFAMTHGRISDGNGGWTNAVGPAHYPGSGFVIGDPGPSDAAYDVGVLAHEITHQYLGDLGIGYGRNQAGAFQEGFANYGAASFLRDPIIGRVFGLGVTNGHAHYDLNAGLEMGSGRLITTRGDYVANEQLNANPAVAQARRGVEPHTGSGVVSTPLTQISNAIGWNNAQRLAYDAVSNPALNGHVDFGRFADSIRLTALDRYPVNSPEFQAIETALNQAGITGWPAQGQTVSRITSRGTVEHGATFLHYQQDGRAVLRQPNGDMIIVNQFGFLNDPSLAHGFAAQRRVPSSGTRSPDVTMIAPAPGWGNNAAAPNANGSPWPAPGAAAQGITGAPQGIANGATLNGSTTTPTLGRRVADHLLLSPQATAATAGAVSAQQVLDRREREREQEEAFLLAELERLGFLQAGITGG